MFYIKKNALENFFNNKKKMSWRKPLPIKTYTDLSIYFYGNDNCTSTNLVKYIDKNLECENKDMYECCHSEIEKMYNKTFRFDTCYVHNNTNIQFQCNGEFFREIMKSMFIYLIIILACFIIFEICRIKLKNHKEKKSENELLIVSTNNTEYGTYKYADN